MPLDFIRIVQRCIFARRVIEARGALSRGVAEPGGLAPLAYRLQIGPVHPEAFSHLPPRVALVGDIPHVGRAAVGSHAPFGQDERRCWNGILPASELEVDELVDGPQEDEYAQDHDGVQGQINGCKE